MAIQSIKELLNQTNSNNIVAVNSIIEEIPYAQEHGHFWTTRELAEKHNLILILTIRSYDHFTDYGSY